MSALQELMAKVTRLRPELDAPSPDNVTQSEAIAEHEERIEALELALAQIATS